MKPLSATWILFFLTVTGLYTVLGHWLYISYRVPVGNTGLYAEGLAQIAQGHLGGYVSFTGTTLGADAGEFIAYFVAPLWLIFGFSGLWALWGFSVAFSYYLAWRLAGVNSKVTTHIVLGLVTVGNPLILSNFITSWDFDILFMPGVLSLALLIKESRSWAAIGVVAVLTALIKDEVGIILSAWGIIEALAGNGNKWRWLLISGLGVGTYGFGVLCINGLWPGTPSQLALHYAAIGGAEGLSGIVRFVVAHPIVVLNDLSQHEAYAFQLIAASGGAALLSWPGLLVGLIWVINALGSGPLGQLMSIPNFEFTLFAVPFMVLGAIYVLKRYPLLWVPMVIVWSIFLGLYAAQFLPGVLLSPLPAADLAAWHAVEQWYDKDPRPPVVYTQNNAAAHFLAGPAAGVGVDSLHQIARLARQFRRPLVIIYDPRLVNDGAPRRWPKRIAALVYDHAIKVWPAYTRGDLHVYVVNIARLLNSPSTVTPVGLTIVPWMWRQGLTLDLVPGVYRVDGDLVRAVGATLIGDRMLVPASSYLSSVTLTGYGYVTLIRQSYARAVR